MLTHLISAVESDGSINSLLEDTSIGDLHLYGDIISYVTHSDGTPTQSMHRTYITMNRLHNELLELVR